MASGRNTPEDLLNEALAAVRDDVPGPRVVEEAGRRVWDRVEHSLGEGSVSEPIRSCADFQALIPSYLDRTLVPARRFLLDDHLHECVACRRAYQTAQKLSVEELKPAPRRKSPLGRYAIAASLAAGIAVAGWYAYTNLSFGPAGPRAVVASSEGAVYRLAGGRLSPVSTGAELKEDESLRTGNGGRALLRLGDGSIVETSERAELSLSATRKDTTIHLQYGSIIVQAAKQRKGHLYVLSDDCRVAVTGTVFSVNRGTKGSRVSVVEGSVHVESNGGKTVLGSGQQTSTDPSMSFVSVEDEISWSRNFDQHLALLRELATLKKNLDNVQMPALRYSSRFLDAVPADSTIVIDLPNLGSAAGEAGRLLEVQARQSPVLRDWNVNGGPRVADLLRRVQQISGYLGDEIMVAFPHCRDFCGVLIAETSRPGLRSFIESEYKGAGFRFVEGTTVPPTVPGQLLVAQSGNRIVVGEQAFLVQAALQGGTGFSQSPFGMRIADTFRKGTGIVVAVDLQRLFEENAPAGGKRDVGTNSTGMSEMRYLIAEHKSVGSQSQYSATVNFTGARRGVASWLGTPSPMGSLQLVSPDAQFVSAATVKDPVAMLDDVMGLFGDQGLREVERDLRINVRTEIAAALGSEVTVALDGPLLPVPSWKLLLEVNDPVRLQSAIERIVTAVPGVKLSSEKVGNQTWYILVRPVKGVQMEAHYVFADGYLVACTNRGLLAKALQVRQSGNTFAKSTKFKDLLPRDRHASFSALVYQNAGDLAGLLASGANSLGQLNAGQQKAAQEIAESLGPVLVCAYGEADRIELASNTGLLNTAMQNLFTPLFGRGTFNPQAAYR